MARILAIPCPVHDVPAGAGCWTLADAYPAVCGGRVNSPRLPAILTDDPDTARTVARELRGDKPVDDGHRHHKRHRNRHPYREYT